MEDAINQRAWARWVLAALVLFGGGALVVQNGLALAWAQSNPVLAHRLSPGNGIALSGFANFQMLTAQNDGDMQSVLDTARKAVARAPLEAEAIRNAGFVIAARGDETKADPIISLAARVSKRDYFAHAWLLDRKFRLNRVDGAVEEADIVLRQRVTSWPVIFPELARISADPRVVEPLARALATRPYWRGSFFEVLGPKAPDQVQSYRLFRRLAALGAPASTSEQQSWFGRFDGETEARTWFARWQALLPRKLPKSQALLRDGGFEGLDAPTPFNWMFLPSDGTYAERTKNPDGPGKVLYLSFEGKRQTDLAVQSLILAPGKYAISLRLYADESMEKGKIGMALRCGRFVSSRPLTRLDLAPVPGRWIAQSIVADIPADCPAPQLWFEGRQGNALDPATVFIDDVSIQPLSAVKRIPLQLNARLVKPSAAPKIAARLPVAAPKPPMPATVAGKPKTGPAPVASKPSAALEPKLKPIEKPRKPFAKSVEKPNEKAAKKAVAQPMPERPKLRLPDLEQPPTR